MFLLRRRRARRVLVIGLDCASPELIFDHLRGDLPTLQRLMTDGVWGRLRSSIPCITVPAWASMMSSRDPGVLGCYGFRNRRDYSYDGMTTADSSIIRVPRIWDILSAAGKQSVVVGAPQTYPVRPLLGHLVSDFMTPGTETTFTFPPLLKGEVLNVAPDYRFDVREFRTPDKANLLHAIQEMTARQTTVVRHLMRSKPWDFFMYMNIGTDRMHHGFWRFHDPQHRLHEPTSPFRNVIRDYYRSMDALISDLLALAGEETIVLVVSDHGVKRMDGGICVNEWLWRNGWLALRTPPPDGQIARIEDCKIDWEHTRAWASGGYYGRIFLNVRGREPAGVIPTEHYEMTRDLLSAALRAIPGPDGEALSTSVFKPQAIYQQVNNIAPDLIVYFGDLHWRAVGSMGHGRHFTFENDTGPDDANHAEDGMFILYDPLYAGGGPVADHQLMDIGPTLLDKFGLPIPAEMQGRIITPPS
ncbi:MAG: alkaline phosphatase family protein [Anaerolineae bacterium]|nr:alkaline phosphatase family protein [Anaerolineae bacterium]NUQ02740.1 alkaline phosphatase family protein [Anaerolineae bacterium]